MNERIVIPTKLRRQILENLHAAHQGVGGMRDRANESVYWPGLSRAIVLTRLNCTNCDKHAPSQSSEPMIITEFPKWPFKKIVGDLFYEDGYWYLAVADRYSGWLTV